MNGREQVQSCAAEAQGITVKEQPYGYEVILPHLMPKRNYRNHTVFLLEPLTYALKEFTAVHPICRLEYALIWFIYEYTDGWSNVWEYAYTINYMLLLLLAISLSNVFSIEYYRKTDAIILCSQYGKKQLFQKF